VTRRSPLPASVTLLVALAVSGPAAAATTQVSLLAAGPSVIRIGVTFAPLQLEPSTDTPGAMLPRVDGCLLDGAPGSPQLPVRVVHVAVPPEGPVTARAFGSGETTQEGVALEVVPSADPAWRGLGEPALRRVPDAAVTGSTKALLPLRARILSVSWLRNQRVASIAVYPVDYVPASRRLTAYSRIEVEVDVAESGVGTALAEANDAFESVYARTLINYEQGKRWRRPAATTSRLRATPRARLKSGALVSDGTTSSFAGHRWVKLAIPRSGFYRVTYSQIRTLEPFVETSGVPFDSVYVYGWPGSPILSETAFCDSCDYEELATGIEDAGNDGRMSQNADAIYFYAQGANDWDDEYDPSAADSLYTADPYEKTSFVFITCDRHRPGETPFTSKRRQIATASAAVNPVGGETIPTSFIARQHLAVQSPTEYYPGMHPSLAPSPRDPSIKWDKFFWRTMGIDQSINVTIRTPGADRTQPARVRVRSWGLFGSNGACSPPAPDHLLDVVMGQDSVRAGWFSSPGTARMFPVLDTLNFMRIGIPFITGCSGRVDPSVLTFVEVYYPHLLVPEDDSLHIETQGNGTAIYNAGPFVSSTAPRVFDVTDPFAPRELLSFSYVASAGTPTTFTLSFEVTESGPSRYDILPSASFNKPPASDFTEVQATSLDNLRGTNHDADYLLIYYDGFQGPADTLLAWRRNRLPLDGNPGPYDVVGVPISAIYDQFSGGRTDPTAIRNFLRAVFHNWHQGGHAAPAFVTFFGDASFDFKNLFGLAVPGQSASLIPTFEDGYSGGQFSTDDWLVNVDDPVNVLPDFFAGRIPAPDLTTAQAYLQQKLLFYERSAPSGTYRDRVMFIADDDVQGADDDVIHWGHVRQTAVLDTVCTPDHVDRAYVYLHTYATGPGITKPGAKADIKNTINGDGVAIVNFIGHGSPFKLTDENVLIDTDAGTLTNATKLPLFVAASCDVGRFSDPRVQSLGERLLLAPSGGAVGVISATEIAYSDFNAQMGDSLFLQLFDRAPATGQYHVGVSPALLTAKLLSLLHNGSMVNNEKYPLMSDAALRLNLPKLWVDVGFYDASGTTPVTEIRGGQTLTFRGRVLDGPGGTLQPYTGIVDLLIEDSQPRDVTPDCELLPGCQPRSEYDFKAGPIYRGNAAVTGGSFQGKFVVPLEAQIGPRGKIRAYVSGLPAGPPTADGVGSLRVQVSPGVSIAGDTQGPNIALSFPGGVLSVRPDATLRIDLNDPSGILTTGHTIQNGIVVTVDDNTTARTDVTSSFRYATGSYTNGTAYFTLPNLAPGSHTVKVSAADNMAAGLTAFEHRSSASLAFDVVNSPPVQIRNAYLFPNPTESGRRASGGTFVVDGPGDSVNVMIRIFTVSGRMIRQLTSFGQFGQVQMPWDGLDAEGYPLANGVYLFKVYVNGRDPRGGSDPRQHVAADGRLVILNH
jgi:hypothetical protein